MSPGRALVRSLSYFFTTRGRTGRAEFWWLAFIISICFCACAQIPRWTMDANGKLPNDYLFVMAVIIGVLSIMMLTAACRRLHDSEHQIGWILLVVVPVLGWFALIALLLMRGTHGVNQHGPDPAPWRKRPGNDHPALEAVANAEAQRVVEVQLYYDDMLRK